MTLWIGFKINTNLLDKTDHFPHEFTEFFIPIRKQQ